MKIGYPCINTEIGCTANSTFRLKNYSEKNLIEKINNNLDCLEKILEYNKKNNLLFFRISSDLIPFASHPVFKFDFKNFFKKRFEKIGKFIKNNDIRISMHPDQFVLINAKKESICEKSILELKWHCEVLDLMKLDKLAKVQIHVGGVYGDKNKSINRFILNYKKLENKIKKRLVIENDDKSYSLKDCLYINKKTNIPIVFDCFHHFCLNNKENTYDALKAASFTWKKEDGIMMTDYSSQEPNSKIGKHIKSIDLNHFKNYLKEAKELDFDIMLEIKDKQISAKKALKLI